MTTHSRTHPVGVTAYYLGRPAALWLGALTPRRRPADHHTCRAPATAPCSSPSDTRVDEVS
jgi:hypothetical protein